MLLTIICLLKKLRERKKKENVCILLYLPSYSPFAVFFIPLSELASRAISLQAEKLPLAFLAVQLCLQQIISVVIYLKMMGLLINSLFSTTCSPDSYHIFQVVENLITVQCISFLKFSMCTRVHTHTLRHTLMGTYHSNIQILTHMETSFLDGRKQDLILLISPLGIFPKTKLCLLP